MSVENVTISRGKNLGEFKTGIVRIIEDSFIFKKPNVTTESFIFLIKRSTEEGVITLKYILN